MMTILPLIIFLGPILLLIIYFYFWKKFSATGRRNPLTSQLLRSPGESLREKIDDLTIDIDSYLLLFFCSPLFLYSLIISQLYFTNTKLNTSTNVFYVIAIIAVMGLGFVKLGGLLRLRRAYRLGFEGEMAVGQELNQLMFDGYKVYHDFLVTEKGFNIDHVAIGPAGVFAVETKTKTKKEVTGTTVDANVIFDGRELKFPGWSTMAPLDQAKRQAAWLSEWLSKAVGENVPVRPVLAFPGWYIKLEQSSDVFVFNGKNPQNMLKGQKVVLSAVLIKTISNRIEERCRNVAPLAYKKEETKQ